MYTKKHRTETKNFDKEEQSWITYTKYTLKAYNSTLSKTVQQYCTESERLVTFEMFCFMKYLLALYQNFDGYVIKTFLLHPLL